MQPDLFVNDWAGVFQLLTSRPLSCSATVSSGNAMGNMMQQVESELQYRCGSVSGSDMGSSTVAAMQRMEGSRPSISSAETNAKIRQYFSVAALREHTPC